MRREVPILITSIAGLVFAISYFIPQVGGGLLCVKDYTV